MRLSCTTTLLILALLFNSCSEDKAGGGALLSELTVTLTADTESIDSYANFVVTLTELKSGLKFTETANSKGLAVFNIPAGAYDIVAEDIFDGASRYYGVEKNYTLSDMKEGVIVKIQNIIATLDKTFVLDELYFNGDRNENDYMGTMYEQYFTIRNISDRALYVDGLSFGVAGDYNNIETENDMSALLPEVVVISQFYTIPGDGQTYKVEPNSSIVVAMSARNHKEGGEFGTDYPMEYPGGDKSVDLSGADFEIYVQGGMTPDNPEVANVIVNFTTFQAFHWQYSGASPMVLFRLDMDPVEFIEKNRAQFENPMGSMIQDFIKLPVSYIIDAVETGVIDMHFKNILPLTIDKTPILNPSTGSFQEGFSGHFIKRKSSIINGVKTIQDTNDSSQDYILLTGGQKDYPAK